MKDYLKESLSNDEKAYIYGIIKKTALKYIGKIYNETKNRPRYIIEENLEEK